MDSKLHPVREMNSLKELVNQGAELFGDRPAFLAKEKKGGEYFEITFKQFKEDVDALGTKLMELGLEGKKIAVMGNNCYHWVVAYFAVANGAGVVVPLDKELKANEIYNLIDTAECSAVFYTSNFSKYFKDYDIEYKIPMDVYMDSTVEPVEGSMASLIAAGKELVAGGDRSFIDKELDPEAMSALLFTSGTTGVPKGVMLCHRNFSYVVRATTQIVSVKGEIRSLSVLPIHHTFESTIGIMVVLFQGGSIAFCEGLKYVLKNMQQAKASLLIGVPLIVESIYSKIWKEAEKTGKAKL